LKKTLTSQLFAPLFEWGNSIFSGVKIFICHWEWDDTLRSIRPRISGVNTIQLTTYNPLLAFFPPYTAHKHFYVIAFDSSATDRHRQRWIMEPTLPAGRAYKGSMARPT